MHGANDKTHWFSISVTVAPEVSEAIEYAFNSLEAVGTEINHLRKKNAERVTVVGYFNDLPDEETVEDELQYSLRVYGFSADSVIQIERNKIDETDWLAEWKKHWRPTAVGNFVIAPSWSEVAEDSSIVIRIEPNMAFGTGTHETTQLCLQAIENLYRRGDSFLDVGTGTGILAIAAALVNARSQASNGKFLACDTDADSIKIAKENAELNGVSDTIGFEIGSITETTPVFDFVCANLTLDVILPHLPL
ncbi:MAG TPA: 50S ribosomal protein L11 methyltransferase, partial [Pyrinomonadaceae bacterium]